MSEMDKPNCGGIVRDANLGSSLQGSKDASKRPYNSELQIMESLRRHKMMKGEPECVHLGG